MSDPKVFPMVVTSVVPKVLQCRTCGLALADMAAAKAHYLVRSGSGVQHLPQWVPGRPVAP